MSFVTGDILTKEGNKCTSFLSNQCILDQLSMINLYTAFICVRCQCWVNFMVKNEDSSIRLSTQIISQG